MGGVFFSTSLISQIYSHDIAEDKLERDDEVSVC